MSGAWYFKHDYSAKADQKIIELEMEFGKHIGYSMWFRLLESMGEAGGVMPKKRLELYTIMMQVDYDFLIRFIAYCIEIGLIKETDEYYYNERFLNDFNKIRNVSDKNAQNANTRWNKTSGQEKNSTNIEANQEAKPQAKAEPKPEVQPEAPAPAPAPESEQITRLRSYAQAIFDEIGSGKNKPELTTEGYQKLLDKWGYDKLVQMQRIYYEWKASLNKKSTHTDYGTLIKGTWVLDKLNEIQKAKDGTIDYKNPSGRWIE